MLAHDLTDESLARRPQARATRDTTATSQSTIATVQAVSAPTSSDIDDHTWVPMRLVERRDGERDIERVAVHRVREVAILPRDGHDDR